VFVGVLHHIKDREAFGSRGQALDDPPPGLRLRHFYPSTDGSAATCLWEGDSVDAVRVLIDSTLGDASEETYFEVDVEHAMGLPEGARATA
jgi:hypothetical protein